MDFFVSVSAVCSLYSIRRLYYPASFIVRPASSEFPSTLPSSEQIYSSRRFFSSPFCLAHSLKTARRPRVYIYTYIYIYIYIRHRYIYYSSNARAFDREMCAFRKYNIPHGIFTLPEMCQGIVHISWNFGHFQILTYGLPNSLCTFDNDTWKSTSE